MPWVHFGIGQNTEIDSVVIRWPMGLIQVLKDIPINQYHEVREGESISSITKNSNESPIRFKLEQNFPNPFNPTTCIQYQLIKPDNVKLSIYNNLGEIIKVLVNEHQSAGFYTVHWNGVGDQGKMAASGLYFYRLETRSFMNFGKMVYLR